MRYAAIAFFAFVLGSFCAISQSRANAQDQISAGPTFSEIEQLRLINLYRKGTSSAKLFQDANCFDLSTAANADGKAYNDLLHKTLKAHNLPETTDVTIDLKADTIQPKPKEAAKK